MKITSKQAGDSLRDLKDAIIQQLKDLLIERVDFEDQFDDSVGNNLIGINSQSVFFGGYIHNQDEYPIDELSIEDAIYILSIIE